MKTEAAADTMTVRINNNWDLYLRDRFKTLLDYEIANSPIGLFSTCTVSQEDLSPQVHTTGSAAVFNTPEQCRRVMKDFPKVERVVYLVTPEVMRELRRRCLPTIPDPAGQPTWAVRDLLATEIEEHPTRQDCIKRAIELDRDGIKPQIVVSSSSLTTHNSQLITKPEATG